MIEKKIHYCWFGEKELPRDVKKCIKSWEKKCPDYEIVRWDESNFNINCCEFVKVAYQNKAWAFVSDYARLKIIYDKGGIYLDTDVELLRNLDDLLKNETFFSIQQDQNICATGLGFGAIKNSSVIKEMLSVYEDLVFDLNNLEKLACPNINDRVLKRYHYENNDQIQYFDNNKVTIYPSKYFDPIAPGKTKNLLCEETYSIHHYSYSWGNKKDKLRRRIINLIGQERINKIKMIIKRS